MKMRRGPAQKKMPLGVWAEKTDRKLRETRAVREFEATTRLRLLEPAEVRAEAEKKLKSGEITPEQLREATKKRPDLRRAVEKLVK